MMEALSSAVEATKLINDLLTIACSKQYTDLIFTNLPHRAGASNSAETH